MTDTATDFADMTLDELRIALAPDIAASAIFDGWNETALVAAAEMAGADVDVAKLAPFIRKALKGLTEKGKLVQTKGTGASGSFKLAAAANAVADHTKDRPKVLSRYLCLDTITSYFGFYRKTLWQQALMMACSAA